MIYVPERAYQIAVQSSTERGWFAIQFVIIGVPDFMY